MIEVICEVHFREIFSTQMKHQVKFELSKDCLIDLKFFKKKIL